mmetsp:Transcript_151642/g.385562  ORF Transcript_151642/g.385562 Transcript_151642/m.385562 type:complete len:139 (-) Transcript_151642:838-1254(-)
MAASCHGWAKANRALCHNDAGTPLDRAHAGGVEAQYAPPDDTAGRDASATQVDAGPAAAAGPPTEMAESALTCPGLPPCEFIAAAREALPAWPVSSRVVSAQLMFVRVCGSNSPSLRLKASSVRATRIAEALSLAAAP